MEFGSLVFRIVLLRWLGLDATRTKLESRGRADLLEAEFSAIDNRSNLVS